MDKGQKIKIENRCVRLRCLDSQRLIVNNVNILLIVMNSLERLNFYLSLARNVHRRVSD